MMIKQIDALRCFVVEDQGDLKGENRTPYTIWAVDGRKNVVGGDFKCSSGVFHERAESSGYPPNPLSFILFVTVPPLPYCWVRLHLPLLKGHWASTAEMVPFWTVLCYNGSVIFSV